MNSKQINWWCPQMGEIELKYLKDVLSKNFPNEGEYTEKFTQEIARLLDVKYALAVTSGSAALFLALKALGIGHNDEVIVPDLTFIATPNAVDMSGAKPVLIDIEPERLTICPEALKKAITPQTKAVIPVHISGRAANMPEILKICHDNSIAVIEDAAEAFLSKSMGQCLGTFGEIGCFSLSPAKTITTGQGGLIVTNNDKLFNILRPLKDQGRPVRGTGGDDIHESIGYNFKFTDLQGAVGLAQLNYLQKRQARMRHIQSIYRQRLGKLPELLVCPFDEGEIPQWTDILFADRDNLESFLRTRNIDCRRFWHPIHQQKPYLGKDEEFPVCSQVAKQALWLPSAFSLQDEDINLVCDYIEEYLG